MRKTNKKKKKRKMDKKNRKKPEKTQELLFDCILEGRTDNVKKTAEEYRTKGLFNK